MLDFGHLRTDVLNVIPELVPRNYAGGSEFSHSEPPSGGG